jgi:hypothetical protein
VSAGAGGLPLAVGQVRETPEGSGLPRWVKVALVKGRTCYLLLPEHHDVFGRDGHFVVTDSDLAATWPTK